MKPRYRTPFEGLILRDGRTKGSNPPLRYFWHRWTRSDDTAAPPVFTSASHPLEIAFLSRAGLPDDNGPIGFCMLPGRRKAKRRHRWARDLSMDIASINQGRLCLVTLCTETELIRDSPGFQARIAEFACREHLPIADKRSPGDARAFDALVARLVERIEREDMRVVVHCNGGKCRSALVTAAVLIGLGVSQSAAVAGVRAARPALPDLRAAVCCAPRAHAPRPCDRRHALPNGHPRAAQHAEAHRCRPRLHRVAQA